MVAIIEVGKKQFLIQPGKELHVPRLKAQAGDVVRFTNVLNNESVNAEVLEHGLGKKVVSRKFRNKTRYQRTKGHRQPYTAIVVKETTKETKKVAQKSKKEA